MQCKAMTLHSWTGGGFLVLVVLGGSQQFGYLAALGLLQSCLIFEVDSEGEHTTNKFTFQRPESQLFLFIAWFGAQLWQPCMQCNAMTLHGWTGVFFVSGGFWGGAHAFGCLASFRTTPWLPQF